MSAPENFLYAASALQIVSCLFWCWQSWSIRKDHQTHILDVNAAYLMGQHVGQYIGTNLEKSVLDEQAVSNIQDAAREVGVWASSVDKRVKA